MILPASYRSGFAPRDGRPLYPELWRGCVGAWAPCLGPSGLTLRDWSGFGNHGTLTNMVAGDDWVPSHGGYALDFDGSNDYVTVPDAASLNPGAAMSCFAWIKTSATSSYSAIVDKYVGSAGYQVVLHNSNVLRVDLGAATARTVIGTTNLESGRWIHIGMTYDGAQMRIFVNGTEEGVAAIITGSVVSSGQAIVIGNDNEVGGRFFSGMIDDIRIYNRALPAQGIKDLASRRGIAYELAPRRRPSVQVVGGNRRRRLLLGAQS